MSAKAFLLDVGHGAAAFATDGAHTVVVDAAPTDTLPLALEQQGLSHIDAVLITHADHDHIGGLVTLLSDPEKRVQAVYLNPDPTKRLSSRRRRQLAAALEDALAAGRSELHLSLTDLDGRELSVGELEIEVLAPVWQHALAGAGGSTQDDEQITSNTMSAVVRISAGDGRLLLCGDLDLVGLRALTEQGRDMTAEYLVYPHHGGLPAVAIPLSLPRPSVPRYGQSSCSSRSVGFVTSCLAPRLLTLSARQCLTCGSRARSSHAAVPRILRRQMERTCSGYPGMAGRTVTRASVPLRSISASLRRSRREKGISSTSQTRSSLRFAGGSFPRHSLTSGAGVGRGLRPHVSAVRTRT